MRCVQNNVEYQIDCGRLSITYKDIINPKTLKTKYISPEITAEKLY